MKVVVALAAVAVDGGEVMVDGGEVMVVGFMALRGCSSGLVSDHDSGWGGGDSGWSAVDVVWWW